MCFFKKLEILENGCAGVRGKEFFKKKSQVFPKMRALLDLHGKQEVVRFVL